MRCSLSAVFLFLLLYSTYAQPYTSPVFEQQLHKLQQKVTDAKNDSDRIVTLGRLAEFYYIYRLNAEGDSVLQKQLTAAEIAQNKNLILLALLNRSSVNLTSWTNTETFDHSLKFIDQGLEYAMELGNMQYVALAHIRKANLLRKRGQLDNALQEVNMAFVALGNEPADSTKAVLFLEAGDIYLAKGEAVTAFKNFINAFDIGYTLKNIPLQSETYHHYYELYRALKYDIQAKENLMKSLALNKEYNNQEGILKDYIDLARLTDDQQLIDSVIAIATALHKEGFRLHGKRLMLAYYMVKTDSRQALNYFNSNEDLQLYYRNPGLASYYSTLGNIYYYPKINKRLDSALFYYKLAEPELEHLFDAVNAKSDLYKQIGSCYAGLQQPQMAIVYFEKALEISKSDYNVSSSILSQLSDLYAKASDYSKAYIYNNQYVLYKDSLEKLNGQREIALLGIEHQNDLHLKELEEQQNKILKKINLQYWAIGIAIASLFTLILLVGMFPISRLTIKMLGFFSFICLFEFLVLMIDSYLHRFTHGEPLKIWLIKIFLIALLVPLQHFLEHSMVKFLASQKLLRMRNSLSIKRWWLNMKKPVVTDIEASVEKDTAVL